MKDNKMMTIVIAVIAVVIIGGAGIYFLTQNNQTSETNVSETATTTENQPTEAMASDKTIVDLAVEAGNFNTLVAAVQKAGLVETLSGEGPYTVFAPTDEAFEKLLANLGISAEELLAREDLADILTYHVVPGKVMAADVVGLDSATTVQGGKVAIKTENGVVMINNAKVLATDVEGSNGVIHVIDTVLIPQ